MNYHELMKKYNGVATREFCQEYARLNPIKPMGVLDIDGMALRERSERELASLANCGDE